MSYREDTNRVFGVIVGGIAVGLLAVGILALLSEVFSDSNKQKGKLLAKREKYLMDKTEFYERGIERRITEVSRVKILEPKKFVEIYSRKQLK